MIELGVGHGEVRPLWPQAVGYVVCDHNAEPSGFGHQVVCQLTGNVGPGVGQDGPAL